MNKTATSRQALLEAAREIARRDGLGHISIRRTAAMCGVSREMWGKYERDIAMPGGDVLIKIALAGVDLNHLLTGQRTGGAAAPAPALAPDEEILLDNYRHAPAGVRAGVKTTLETFAPGAGGRKRGKAA